MHGVFWGAKSFNGDLSAWNVGNVINMNAMFGVAESFNGDLRAWNVSRVTDMSRMFVFARAFRTLEDNCRRFNCLSFVSKVQVCFVQEGQEI